MKWIKGHQDDKDKNSRLPTDPIPPSTVQCTACKCTLLNDTKICQQHQSPYCHYVSSFPAPKTALPIESCLNILANENASYFLECPYPRAAMQAPHDPTTHISVLFKGATLTGDYRKHIREQVFDPYHYNLQRYKWDHKTYNTIDWASFGSVFSKQFNKRKKFTYQLCNRKLPTGARLFNIDPKYDHRCASCSCKFEDDNHLLQCPA